MKTLTDLINLRKGNQLTGLSISENLVESEGQQGSTHVKSLGHPLQHIAVLMRTQPGNFNQIGNAYHTRGPVKFPQSGPNVGTPKAQGITSHSQFANQDQAENFIAMALSSKGGDKAMKILKDPQYTIKLTYGLPHGVTAVSRSAHAVADPLVAPERCFVLVEPRQFDSVVLELHHSVRLSDGLHLQSAYPSSTGHTPGQCTLEITTHPSKSKMTKVFND